MIGVCSMAGVGCSWIGDLDGLFDGVLVAFLWLVLRGVWGECWMG